MKTHQGHAGEDQHCGEGHEGRGRFAQQHHGHERAGHGLHVGVDGHHRGGGFLENELIDHVGNGGAQIDHAQKGQIALEGNGRIGHGQHLLERQRQDANAAEEIHPGDDGEGAVFFQHRFGNDQVEGKTGRVEQDEQIALEIAGEVELLKTNDCARADHGNADAQYLHQTGLFFPADEGEEHGEDGNCCDENAGVYRQGITHALDKEVLVAHHPKEGKDGKKEIVFGVSYLLVKNRQIEQKEDDGRTQYAEEDHAFRVEVGKGQLAEYRNGGEEQLCEKQRQMYAQHCLFY